jgi:hypothetical protein
MCTCDGAGGVGLIGLEEIFFYLGSGEMLTPQVGLLIAAHISDAMKKISVSLK